MGTAGSNRRAFFGSGWNIRPLLISCGGLNGFLVRCSSSSVDDRGPPPSNPSTSGSGLSYERTGLPPTGPLLHPWREIFCMLQEPHEDREVNETADRSLRKGTVSILGSWNAYFR